MKRRRKQRPVSCLILQMEDLQVRIIRGFFVVGVHIPFFVGNYF